MFYAFEKKKNFNSYFDISQRLVFITVRDFLNGISSALEKLFEFINGIVNDLIGKVLDPVLNPLLDFVSNLLPNLPLPEIDLDFANIEGPS